MVGNEIIPFFLAEGFHLNLAFLWRKLNSQWACPMTLKKLLGWAVQIFGLAVVFSELEIMLIRRQWKILLKIWQNYKSNKEIANITVGVNFIQIPESTQ